MGQLAVINAPSTFTMIWNAMRPWLSKETAAKVDVLGTDYKRVLLELIDEENLPALLGGSCACDEAGGCHLSGAGPWQDGRVGWGPKAMEKGNVVDSRRVDLNSEVNIQESVEGNNGVRLKGEHS
jgi:hypothetical protein